MYVFLNYNPNTDTTFSRNSQTPRIRVGLPLALVVFIISSVKLKMNPFSYIDNKRQIA